MSQAHRVAATAPIGLVFNGPPYTTRDVIAAAQLAEQSGFDSVWYAEDPFGPDPFTALASVAYATKRVRVGTCVISPFTRTWPIIASSFAALDQLSNGRSIIGLGVGTSWLPLIGRPAAVTGVVQTMRSCVAFIRSATQGEDIVLNEESPVFGGRPVSLKRAFNWSPWEGFHFARDRIPIHIGTRGPRMLRLAGEIADGLLLENNIPILEVRRAIEAFRDAARASGRDPLLLELNGVVLFSPSHDGSVDPTWRSYFAAICPAMIRSDAERWGYDWEQISKCAEAWVKGEEARAASLVPVQMMRDLVVAGSRTECVEKLLEYRDTGATPIVMPEACDIRLAIDVAATYARSK